MVYNTLKLISFHVANSVAVIGKWSSLWFSIFSESKILSFSVRSVNILFPLNRSCHNNNPHDTGKLGRVSCNCNTDFKRAILQQWFYGAIPNSFHQSIAWWFHEWKWPFGSDTVKYLTSSWPMSYFRFDNCITNVLIGQNSKLIGHNWFCACVGGSSST